MEGERRKRKIDEVEAYEDEEEDEKMNKFFALIRSTKEMRNQIQKPPAAAAAVARVWNPSFQAEDFIDPGRNRIAIGSSKTVIGTEAEVGVANREEMEKIVEKEEEEEEEDNENVKEEEKEGKELLDLNLSLW